MHLGFYPSYRRLAKKYHPDRNNSYSSTDLIRKINAAFEVLSDKEKRKQCDKMGLDRGLSNFTLMSKYSRVQHEFPKRVRADIITKINSREYFKFSYTV
jgi:DnaJ-class molecular chaperone